MKTMEEARDLKTDESKVISLLSTQDYLFKGFDSKEENVTLYHPDVGMIRVTTEYFLKNFAISKIDAEWKEIKDEIEDMIDHSFGRIDIRSSVEECLDESELDEDDKKLLRYRSEKLMGIDE